MDVFSLLTCGSMCEMLMIWWPETNISQNLSFHLIWKQSRLCVNTIHLQDYSAGSTLRFYSNMNFSCRYYWLWWAEKPKTLQHTNHSCGASLRKPASLLWSCFQIFAGIQPPAPDCVWGKWKLILCLENINNLGDY